MQNAWNDFYSEFGCLISDFVYQIEREMLRGYKKYLAEMSEDEKCKSDFEFEPEFDSMTAVEEEKFEKLKESVRSKYQQYHRKK